VDLGSVSGVVVLEKGGNQRPNRSQKYSNETRSLRSLHQNELSHEMKY
jgi:hypothetical protein